MFESFDALTITELKTICRDEKITNYSNLRKSILLKHIKKHKLEKIIHTSMEKLLAIK